MSSSTLIIFSMKLFELMKPNLDVPSIIYDILLIFKLNMSVTVRTIRLSDCIIKQECMIFYFCFQDRKIMIKSMKTHVVKICTEEYPHLVMLAMFDAVDDTKLVQKAILEVK